MLTISHSKTKTSKFKKYFIPIVIGIIILLFLFTQLINCPCLFKKIFKISCPACGLTRAFKEILKLNFISSLKYNILAIPLLIILFLLTILYLIDIFTQNNYFEKSINSISKNYNIIIFILTINMIINNIRKI